MNSMPLGTWGGVTPWSAFGAKTALAKQPSTASPWTTQESAQPTHGKRVVESCVTARRDGNCLQMGKPGEPR